MTINKDEAIRLLRDAITEVFRKSMESNVAHIAKAAITATDHIAPDSAATQAATKVEVDAARYNRLRILGAAPYGSKQLENGNVLCFQSMDAFVDADRAAHPSRGEAGPAGQPVAAGESVKAGFLIACEAWLKLNRAEPDPAYTARQMWDSNGMGCMFRAGADYAARQRTSAPAVQPDTKADVGECRWNGGKCACTRAQAQRCEIIESRMPGRSTPAPASDSADGLPPLPEPDEIQTDERFGESRYWGEDSMHAYVLADRAARQVPADEPNMLWDAEDAENCYGDGPEDFANNYASNRMIGGDECDVDVLCAYRGSTRTMRITWAKNDHDEELKKPVSWSWVETPVSPQSGAADSAGGGA